MYRTIELDESDWRDIADGTLREQVRDSINRQLDSRNIRISEVALPKQYKAKVLRICEKFDIKTLGELCLFDPMDFRRERGIGLATIDFLRDLLSDYGIHFGYSEQAVNVS